MSSFPPRFFTGGEEELDRKPRGLRGTEAQHSDPKIRCQLRENGGIDTRNPLPSLIFIAGVNCIPSSLQVSENLCPS